MIHLQLKRKLKLCLFLYLSNNQSSNQFNKFNSHLQRCRLQCSSLQDKQSQHLRIIQHQCSQHQIIDRQIQRERTQKENLMRAIAKKVAKKISDLLKVIDQWVQRNQLHNQNRSCNIHCSQHKNNQNQLPSKLLRNQLSLMIQTMTTMMMISSLRGLAHRHLLLQSRSQLL